MTLADLRDVAIVILAVLAVLELLLLILLTLLLVRLARIVNQRARPILESARATMGDIQSTTSMVSGIVLKPLMRTMSLIVGARKALGFVLGFSRRKGG